MSNRHVAIDGPSASGKTVVSRALAARLGILYLDTGAMYRAVAYLALRHGVELDNDAALVEMLARSSLAIVADETAPNGYRVIVNERDVSGQLTLPDVTAAVSTVAAAPAVRAALVERQRVIAASEPVVMAGRDIGTVVLPDARFKFTTVENVRELIEVMPGWNITQHPAVTEIVEDIEHMLRGIDAKDIRKDTGARADIAIQAAKVIEKMDGWRL